MGISYAMVGSAPLTAIMQRSWCRTMHIRYNARISPNLMVRSARMTVVKWSYFFRSLSRRAFSPSFVAISPPIHTFRSAVQVTTKVSLPCFIAAGAFFATGRSTGGPDEFAHPASKVPQTNRRTPRSEFLPTIEGKFMTEVP
jgi:hypothetical protein